MSPWTGVCSTCLRPRPRPALPPAVVSQSGGTCKAPRRVPSIRSGLDKYLLPCLHVTTRILEGRGDRSFSSPPLPCGLSVARWLAHLFALPMCLGDGVDLESRSLKGDGRSGGPASPSIRRAHSSSADQWTDGEGRVFWAPPMQPVGVAPRAVPWLSTLLSISANAQDA